MKKVFYFLFIVLFIVSNTSAYALTAEEMLLLKRGGISDEKILEIQRKEGSAPAPKINPFDWNEDGKKDIIAGSMGYNAGSFGDNVLRGYVFVHLNIGTNLQPIFDNPIKIPDLEVNWGSNVGDVSRSSAGNLVFLDIDPYIVDWNNDGKKDFVIGQASGEISVFINMGTNKQPIFAPERRLNNGSLDVGLHSSPAIVDWNGDGKKDLVVGNQKGEVYVFLNIGEDSVPEFPSNGIKTDIKVPGYATPFTVDWNNDGKFDVVCGSSDGKIYIFLNEGDSMNPKFSKAQTLQVNNKEIKLPSPTSVIAVDWDDDEKIDLLVSNKELTDLKASFDTGRQVTIPLGIYILINTGTKEKPEFKELKEIKGKFRDDTVL